MAQEIIVSNDRNDLARQQAGLMRAAAGAADRVAARQSISDYLSRRARSTIRNQASALALFAEFLEEAAPGLGRTMAAFAADVATWAGDEANRQPDAGAWSGISWGIVEGFVRWLLDLGYAISSVNNRLSAIKVYARLAMKAGAIPAEELQLIKAVTGYSGKEAKRIDERREQTRIETFTYERDGDEVLRHGVKKAEHASLTPEQAAVLKNHDDNPQGRRDRLLMCLLLDHGLRVSEVAGLQVSAFDLKAGEIHFYRPKVDKWQRHKLTADCLRAAQAYFSQDAPALGPAIVGSRKGGKLTGKPMSKRAITKRVNYLGLSLLGIGSLSAHDCRHYWATDAARNGTDPFHLQEAGGWSSLAMPRRYVEDARIANQGVKLSG